MQTGILITNGGPHPPEKWAYASAGMLLDAIVVNQNSPKAVELEMLKDTMRPQIAAILIKHHEAVQSKERGALEEKKHARMATPLNASEHTNVDRAVEDVDAVMRPLIQNPVLFSDGAVATGGMDVEKHIKSLIRERIEMDLRTNQQIERSWYLDRNPV